MSAVTAKPPTHTPALEDHDTADHVDREHESKRSWVWTLMEALAYVGATIDPTAALAASVSPASETRSCGVAAGEGPR